jgi:hypothetical protein
MISVLASSRKATQMVIKNAFKPKKVLFFVVYWKMVTLSRVCGADVSCSLLGTISGGVRESVFAFSKRKNVFARVQEATTRWLLARNYVLGKCQPVRVRT